MQAPHSFPTLPGPQPPGKRQRTLAFAAAVAAATAVPAAALPSVVRALGHALDLSSCHHACVPCLRTTPQAAEHGGDAEAEAVQHQPQQQPQGAHPKSPMTGQQGHWVMGEQQRLPAPPPLLVLPSLSPGVHAPSAAAEATDAEAMHAATQGQPPGKLATTQTTHVSETQVAQEELQPQVQGKAGRGGGQAQRIRQRARKPVSLNVAAALRVSARSHARVQRRVHAVRSKVAQAVASVPAQEVAEPSLPDHVVAEPAVPAQVVAEPPVGDDSLPLSVTHFQLHSLCFSSDATPGNSRRRAVHVQVESHTS